MKRSTRALVALGLFVGPAASFVGWQSLNRWRAETYASEALTALTLCLMDGSPSVDEVASTKLRQTAIAADVTRDASWPGRCDPYVTASTRALQHMASRATEACAGRCCEGDDRCQALMALRAQVNAARTYLAVGESAPFDADLFVQHATAVDLLGGTPEGVPAAPTTEVILDPAVMQPLYAGDYLRLLTDPAGHASFDLLFYEQERHYARCRLTLGDMGAPAKCGALPQSIPVGMAGELLASERGAPSQMYAQGKEPEGWVHALYDVETGRELSRVEDRPVGGFVWESGTMAHLASGPPARLHRVRRGVAEAPIEIDAPEEVSSGPRLVWDEVLWTEAQGDGSHRIMSQRVLDEDVPLAPPTALATTPRLKNAPSMEICRTDEVLALLVGAADAKGGVDATIVFREKGGWHRAEPVHLGAAQFGFTCRGDTATLSWIVGLEELPDLSYLGEADTEADLPVKGRYSVNRLRCSAGHCKHDEAKVSLERFSRTSRYVAGDAGDAMVVLWRSVLGDVRMLVGPLAHLDEARERSLFDDVEHDGFGWDLERDPIIGRAGNVLLLLSRQIGTSLESETFGVIIGADGDVTPVAVEAPAL